MTNIQSINKDAWVALDAMALEEDDLEIELEGLLDFDSLATSTYTPPEWVVSNFISEASGSMVSAKSGKGKTWISLAVALIAAKGASVGVWEAPKAHKVLYIDGEMHPGDMKERILMLNSAIPGTLDPKNFIFFSSQLNTEDCNILNTKFNARVRNTIRNQGIDLVVIDNLSSLMTSTHSENAKEWGDDWNNWMNRLIRDTDVAVLGVHHAGKGSDEGRGTSGRVRNLRFDWSAASTQEDEDAWDSDVVSLKITAGKVRAKTLHRMYFTFNSALGELTVTEDKPKLSDRTKVRDDIQSLLYQIDYDKKEECPAWQEIVRLSRKYHDYEVADVPHFSVKKQRLFKALAVRNYELPVG